MIKKWEIGIILSKTFCIILRLNKIQKCLSQNYIVPIVLPVVEVPGWGVADHLPVVWLRDHAIVPESLRHANQAKRQEKLLRNFKQFLGIVALFLKIIWIFFICTFNLFTASNRLCLLLNKVLWNAIVLLPFCHIPWFELVQHGKNASWTISVQKDNITGEFIILKTLFNVITSKDVFK